MSALTCLRVHRELGAGAVLCAALVAVSTLFSKQHYVLDVVSGTLLAVQAYALFLRGYPRREVPELDRRVAPVLAFVAMAIVGIGFACFWLAYLLGLDPGRM